MSAAAQAAVAEIDAWCAAQPGLAVERAGTPDSPTWRCVLSGEHKRTIPVQLVVGAHTLTLQSFFMRAPDQDHGQVYALLLRRQLRSYVLRFGLTDHGDVLIVAVVPVHAVCRAELDRMFGQLLSLADETFNRALRLGFADYIQKEQAWRAMTGVPPNPIT